jgi:hypothetical protein
MGGIEGRRSDSGFGFGFDFGFGVWRLLADQLLSTCGQGMSNVGRLGPCCQRAAGYGAQRRLATQAVLRLEVLSLSAPMSTDVTRGNSARGVWAPWGSSSA